MLRYKNSYTNTLKLLKYAFFQGKIELFLNSGGSPYIFKSYCIFLGEVLSLVRSRHCATKSWTC